jgi:UDPglucose 6-dehydrogenase
LVSAIKELDEAITLNGKPKVVAIISTVLPGTVEREIKPIISPLFKLCYNPYFIAMGTTIRDFEDPEFVLLGVDDEEAAKCMEEFYAKIHSKPVFKTAIKNAELIKVCYNTYISMKIAYANTVMEICHKTGADCDSVIDAVSMANRRLMSPAYLRGGMGDGGGCHPRDNIAMSWLARRLDLSYDFFNSIMEARVDQTFWLVDLIAAEKEKNPHLPVVLFGSAFKENTNITTGSPAVLLSRLLSDEEIDHEVVDPFVGKEVNAIRGGPELVFVSTRHQFWKSVQFHPGSVVLDPFRYLSSNESLKHCTYIPIGK